MSDKATFPAGKELNGEGLGFDEAIARGKVVARSDDWTIMTLPDDDPIGGRAAEKAGFNATAEKSFGAMTLPTIKTIFISEDIFAKTMEKGLLGMMVGEIIGQVAQARISIEGESGSVQESEREV